MRKPYGKALRKQFTEMVRKLNPSFEPFKGESEYCAFPSFYPYVHRVNEKLWLFLMLHITPKSTQDFTVEFGWSLLGRYPEVLDSRFPDLEVKPERLEEKEYAQRVRVFCGNDHWWYLEGDRKNWRGHLDGDKRDVTPEEAELKVAKVLGEVKEPLEVQVLPYLQKFVQKAQSKA